LALIDPLITYKTNAAQLLRNPDDAQALVNQFSLLAQNTSVAVPPHLALMRRAVSLAPSRYEAAHNLGSALMRAGQYKESLDVFTKALDLAPGSHKPEALHHVGMAWHDLGEFNEAIAWYDRAIEADPNDVELRQSRAIATLASGDLSGLFDFEVRWHKPARKPIASSGIPRWQGEDLTGKTLIVAHEQGYGDSIHFCRIIPQLKAKRVVLSGPVELTGLVADNFKVDAVIDETGPFDADYYASPMSAFGAMGIQYDQVCGQPYINAHKLNLPERGKLKVGLAWKGSPGYAQDANRSMTLETLAPLFEVPGLAFYSLQVGEFAKDVAKLGLSGFIADLTPLIGDWRDTARAVAAMDVVVTVCTATAHLAAAMGKPTFIMIPFSPCWRWMRGRDTTPWYDSVRLFRQQVPGEWPYPVANVASKLREML